MPERSSWRPRLPRRAGAPVSERAWDRSVLLDARAAPRDPEFVSDGTGLPFALSVLSQAAPPLPADDPAVRALAAAIGMGDAPDGAGPTLRGWRLLARGDESALFGRGRPPHLTTVSLHREGRRGQWRCIAITQEGALRRTRDGIRASSWTPDPDHPPTSQDTVVRLLVTEQTRSGGAFADKRLLVPDVFIDDDEVRVAMFVTPLQGTIQFGARTPTTPVRLRLAAPLGERRLVDASVWEPPSI